MSNRKKARRGPPRPPGLRHRIIAELSRWSTGDRRMAAAVFFCSADVLQAVGVKAEPCLEAKGCAPGLGTPTCIWCVFDYTLTQARPVPAVQRLVLKSIMPDPGEHIAPQELVPYLRKLAAVIAGEGSAAGTGGA